MKIEFDVIVKIKINNNKKIASERKSKAALVNEKFFFHFDSTVSWPSSYRTFSLRWGKMLPLDLVVVESCSEKNALQQESVAKVLRATTLGTVAICLVQRR